jgi:hypothetical protein
MGDCPRNNFVVDSSAFGDIIFSLGHNRKLPLKFFILLFKP